LLWLYGDGFSLGQGNFAFVVYGLASGNSGWQQLDRDYPQLRATMDARAVNAEIFRLAFDKIGSDPIRFATGIAARFWFFVTTFPGDLERFLALTSNRYADGVVYLIAGLTIVKQLRSMASRQVLQLLGFAGIGFVLSAAIIYGDTDLRVFAATFPFFALLFALAASYWHLGAGEFWVSPSGMRREAGAAAILACTLALAAVVGPGVAHRFERARLMGAPICADGGDGLVFYSRAGMARVEILSPADNRSTFLPRIRDEDFARTDSRFGGTPSGRLTGPVTVVAAYDLRSAPIPDPDRYVFISAAPALRRSGEGPTYLCGTFERQGSFRFFRATSLGQPPQQPAEG
jgi:hypothetical protein